MLSARRPGARRRKRRRPLHCVGRARRRRRRREQGRWRGPGRGDPGPGGEGRALSGKGALKGRAARAWPPGGRSADRGTQRCLGGSAAGEGLGRGASLLRPAPPRSSPRESRSLHSPPPSSSSSDGLRLHLPAARAAGTGSARRRRRRKRWRRRLRHPIWRKRVGPRSSERRGARQRAPWRPDRVAAAPARRPSRWPSQSVAARRPGSGTARAPPPPSARPRGSERC